MTANGLELNDQNRFGLVSLADRIVVGGYRNSGINIPGRDGQINPRKRLEPLAPTLRLLVTARNALGKVDGDLGGSGERQFSRNIDMLVRVLGSPQVALSQQQADGSYRLADAVREDGFSALPIFQRDSGADVQLNLIIPSGQWRSADTKTSTVRQNGLVSLPEFKGMSSISWDSTIVICGGTNVKIETEDGDYTFQYNGNIPVTQQLNVFCDTNRLSGVGGLVPDYSKAVKLPGGRYFVMKPNSSPNSDVPKVRISGLGDGGFVQFRSTIKYGATAS